MTRRTLSYLTLTLAAAVAISTTAITLAPALTSAGGKNGNPGDFTTNIDNPLFPLSNLETKIFEGQETDPDTGETVNTRLESVVLEKTRKVNRVKVLVLEEKAYEDDELIERALDYFAQRSDGTVFYFGEDVDNYVGGKVDNHDGSWLAGKDGAEPGIIMPGDPFEGQFFKQENAPGVAEDEATVIALNVSVSTPAGDFEGCLKTQDTNPLEEPPVSEFKFYCPGIGLAREEGPDGEFLALTSYTTSEGAGENATSEEIDDGEEPVSQPVAPVEADEADGDDANDDGAEDDVSSAEIGAGGNALAEASSPVGANEAYVADEDASEESVASGQIDDGEELLPLAGISVDEAITRAQVAASGPVGEIDLEYFEGKLVFNVEIGDKDVKVDAASGTILSADSED